jgi:hypothetical protein
MYFDRFFNFFNKYYLLKKLKNRSKYIVFNFQANMVYYRLIGDSGQILFKP